MQEIPKMKKKMRTFRFGLKRRSNFFSPKNRVHHKNRGRYMGKSGPLKIHRVAFVPE